MQFGSMNRMLNMQASKQKTSTATSQRTYQTLLWLLFLSVFSAFSPPFAWFKSWFAGLAFSGLAPYVAISPSFSNQMNQLE